MLGNVKENLGLGGEGPQGPESDQKGEHHHENTPPSEDPKGEQETPEVSKAQENESGPSGSQSSPSPSPSAPQEPQISSEIAKWGAHIIKQDNVNKPLICNWEDSLMSTGENTMKGDELKRRWVK
jgi:hypothetical protein